MASSASDINKQIRRRDGNTRGFIQNVLRGRWYIVFVATVLGALLSGAFGAILYSRLTVYVAETEFSVQPPVWETLPLNPISAPRSQTVNQNPHMIAPDVVRALVCRDMIDGEAWNRLATAEEYQTAADDVSKSLRIEFDGTTNAVSVTCTRQNERDAAGIAEFAARALIQNVRKEQLETGRERLALVQGQLERTGREIEEHEREERQSGVTAAAPQYDENAARPDTLNEELAKTQAAREQFMARMERLKTQFQSDGIEFPQPLRQTADGAVADSLKEMDKLVAEELNLAILRPDDRLACLELFDQVTDRKREILEATEQLGYGSEGGSETERKLYGLTHQYRQLELEIIALDTRMAAIQTLMEQPPGDLTEPAGPNPEVQQMAGALENSRGEFDTLRNTESKIRAALDRGECGLSRRTPVRVHSMRTKNINLAAIIAAGAAAGLLAGIGAALLLKMNDASFKTAQDVTEHLGLDVIGTIPCSRVDRRRRAGRKAPDAEEDESDTFIASLHAPKSPGAEAYRALRTRFQLATIQRKPRAVLVTSALPAEGKTTTAINMAVTFAESGLRVLLVDADLRRPNVHRVLGMEDRPGLADLLREELDPHAIIRPTRIENLWMAPSGQTPPNPSELIGSDKMRQLMRDLREEFDLVLCDAPSILVVTDPVLLAKCVDTVVLVLSPRYARRETVTRAKKFLETANANIAGAVLNGLTKRRRDHYHQYCCAD